MGGWARARSTIVGLVFAVPLAAQEVPRLSVERIFGKHEFAGAPSPTIHWLKDSASYVDVRAGRGGGSDIVRVDVLTGRTTVLAGAASIVGEDGHRIEIEDLALSDDESRALIFHNSVRVWRANTRGAYHIVDFKSQRVLPISRKPGLQMHAKFSPDGRSIAFVRDNDLFVADAGGTNERQLTEDGGETTINGATDWAYEEEFELRDGFRWSPDSRRIAYWRFDTSPVPVLTMVDEMSLYPKLTPLRYPKAGEPVSRVKIGVIEVTGVAQPVWLATGSDSGAATYVPRMEWAGADSVVVQRMPRRQNQLDVLMLSAMTGTGRVLVSDRDAAWVDVNDGPVWLAGGRMFLWLSTRGGWRQLYLYKRDGSLVRRLTSDGTDVAEIVGVDSTSATIYTVETAPTTVERQVFSYNLLRNPERLRVTTDAGTHRGASIAPTGRYLAAMFSSAGVPPSGVVYDLASGKRLRSHFANAELHRRVAALAIRPPQLSRIPVPSGDQLNAMRIVPADFDSTKKYPVLMYAYGGPGSQAAADEWGGDRYLWHQMLAQRGYVVVIVDNRGTGGRGRAFEKQTHLHLGRLESQDQIDAARWIGQQPWADANRIGIWGWSYGGYLAMLAASRGGSVFKAAIVVAPVADWRLYDALYAERYMSTPVDNPDGYHESTPLTYINGLTASLLLVHGTGDDNVHPQNTMQLVDKLESAGKQFRLMLYPNRTHSIGGGTTQVHLYEMLTRFVETQL